MAVHSFQTKLQRKSKALACFSATQNAHIRYLSFSLHQLLTHDWHTNSNLIHVCFLLWYIFDLFDSNYDNSSVTLRKSSIVVHLSFDPVAVVKSLQGTRLHLRVDLISRWDLSFLFTLCLHRYIASYSPLLMTDSKEHNREWIFDVGEN